MKARPLVFADLGPDYHRRFEVEKNWHTVLWRDIVGMPRDLRFTSPKEWEHIRISGSVLTVGKGYRWDGASGPVVQTPDTMEPSLVHDILYDGMRRGLLGPHYRRYADREYRDRLRRAGMGLLRRWVEWLGLRLFAARYARPPE